MGDPVATADESRHSAITLAARGKSVWLAGGNRKQCHRSACIQSAQKARRQSDQDRAQYRLRDGEAMMSPSIRRRLVLLVLASIAIVWGVALVTSYRQATREVGEWEEARLAELAQILALLDEANLNTLANARIDVREEEKGGEPGASNLDDDDTLPRDALFQVRAANGEVLAGSPQLRALGAWDMPLPSASGTQDVTLGGQTYHSFTLRDGAHGHNVRVLDPANPRSDRVSGVASRIARPTLIALPVL